MFLYFNTLWNDLTMSWNKLTISWNEMTFLWNEITFLWNEVTWNDLTMERNDRIPRRNAQAEICPVRGIERYMEVTRDIKVGLTRGYLFRPITPDLGIKDAPFTSSAAESRLKVYL